MDNKVLDNARDKLKQINLDYAAMFKEYKDKAYIEYKSGLRPYETARPNDHMYPGKAMDEFKESAAKMKLEALNTLAIMSGEVTRVKDLPPDQGAVNRISLLKMQPTVTSEDIDNVLRACGDNYACYRTIESIARANGIYIPAHPIESALSALESEKRYIDTFGDTKRGTSPGAAEFVNWSIDGLPKSGFYTSISRSADDSSTSNKQDAN